MLEESERIRLIGLIEVKARRNNQNPARSTPNEGWTSLECIHLQIHIFLLIILIFSYSYNYSLLSLTSDTLLCIVLSLRKLIISSISKFINIIRVDLAVRPGSFLCLYMFSVY